MKRNKWNAGYTLIEVLVAISILGIIVSPVCANLVMSLRVNNKTDEMLQAQLAVSSAVETLMAEGIAWENHILTSDCSASCSAVHCYYDCSEEKDENGNYLNAGLLVNRFKDVTVETWRENPGDLYYKVEVKSETIPSVEVSTYIHAVEVQIDVPEPPAESTPAPGTGG